MTAHSHRPLGGGGSPVLLFPERPKAERMLLEGKTRTQVAAELGGVSQFLLNAYIPGGIAALRERYPDVVIPDRPGLKLKGRARLLTPDQEKQIGELRAQGKSIGEIMQITGAKKNTIYMTLRRLKAAAAHQKPKTESFIMSGRGSPRMEKPRQSADCRGLWPWVMSLGEGTRIISPVVVNKLLIDQNRPVSISKPATLVGNRPVPGLRERTDRKQRSRAGAISALSFSTFLQKMHLAAG